VTPEDWEAYKRYHDRKRRRRARRRVLAFGIVTTALALLASVCARSETDAVRARAAIVEAARCHGIGSEAWAMQDVAWRESRFEALACGKRGEMGIYQFRPALWDHAVSRMGMPGLSPWVPEDAALVAAWCWAHGLKGHWRVRRAA